MSSDPIDPWEHPALEATAAKAQAPRGVRMRPWLPLGVLVASALVALGLVLTGPSVEPRPAQVPLPFVRAVKVQSQPLRLRVRTHGSVVPRTESDLVPEVSGTVVWISDALVSGGFFERGDPLLRIDPIDMRVELERAEAQLERARAEVRRTSRELERRQGLAERSVASPNELDQAISAERIALANRREAEAMVAAAKKNLERTELSAPFDGRVRDENVDLGQFVTRGAPLATLYAIDFAEVRVPVPDGELAYLDLPLMYRMEDPDPGDTAGALETESSEAQEGAVPESGDLAGPVFPGAEPPASDASGGVLLSARFAGAAHQWRGRVVRTEGELDPKTRMVNVIARIPDPYARTGDRPPLAVGLFVDVEILGREIPEAFVVPRAALRDPSHVWVIDRDDKLRLREVSVLRVEGESAVVVAGLESGERIAAASLDVAVEGMRVRTLVNEPTPAPPGSRPSGPGTEELGS